MLTKPLGTQVAVNVQQWSHDAEKWALLGVEKVCTRAEAAIMYDIACSSMCRLNRNGATLMRKYAAPRPRCLAARFVTRPLHARRAGMHRRHRLWPLGPRAESVQQPGAAHREMGQRACVRACV